MQIREPRLVSTNLGHSQVLYSYSFAQLSWNVSTPSTTRFCILSPPLSLLQAVLSHCNPTHSTVAGTSRCSTSRVERSKETQRRDEHHLWSLERGRVEHSQRFFFWNPYEPTIREHQLYQYLYINITTCSCVEHVVLNFPN